LVYYLTFKGKAMEEKITKEEIEKLIRNVEHPEIAATLDELGLIGDVEFDEDTREGKFVLVLPMLNIPIQVRDMILNSIGEAVGNKVSKLKVSLAEMTEEQKQNFFALSQAKWKL
jgi:metal-sulfur cluster biosynthetic enzyme